MGQKQSEVSILVNGPFKQECRVSSERTQSFSQYRRDDPSPIKGVKLHLPSCNTTRWLKCKGVLLPKQ